MVSHDDFIGSVILMISLFFISIISFALMYLPGYGQRHARNLRWISGISMIVSLSIFGFYVYAFDSNRTNM